MKAIFVLKGWCRTS
ncbi:trp operon leader peptide [Escherichia coli]|nr:trp operon leader peptide [Escherichia coli]